MQRYFFDRVGERPHYDYQGRDCPSPAAASQLAELIALDLAMYNDGQWTGWTIAVCDQHGTKVCAIQVPEPDLVDAA